MSDQIDRILGELFGTGTDPGVTIRHWEFEKKHIANYFGDSDLWRVDYLRDVLGARRERRPWRMSYRSRSLLITCASGYGVPVRKRAQDGRCADTDRRSDRQ